MFLADGQTDKQTDMTKLIVAFCNFANAPKKEPKDLAKVIAFNITLIWLEIEF
jgi:hypothetical protein